MAGRGADGGAETPADCRDQLGRKPEDAGGTGREVVNVADPDTGATLLVGTQRRPGQAVTHARLATEFIVRPTVQGVVIEPLSDAVVLRPTPAGFSLGSASAQSRLVRSGQCHR